MMTITLIHSLTMIVLNKHLTLKLILLYAQYVKRKLDMVSRGFSAADVKYGTTAHAVG